MEAILRSWSDIASHPSIVGKRVTVMNPQGISVRGPIASVYFDQTKRRVTITVHPGKMEVTSSVERPTWMPASDKAEVIDFTIGANCTQPDFSLESTTAKIGVSITLTISNINEHALAD